MRLLLDTHLLIWTLMGSPRLKAPARRRIAHAAGVYVSAASIWEVAIKSTQGKIDVEVDDLLGALEASGLIELPVTMAHAARVAQLPLLHHDPFDRLLIAQALCEPLTLLTVDETLAPYGNFVELIG